MIVGVLALQGDFAKHAEVLTSLGVIVREVRKPSELAGCEALIIPGGESTTLFRQMDFIHLREALVEFSHQKSLFGTCAGLILMSKKISGSPQKPLGIINVAIERNAFGRQLDSFKSPLLIELDHPTRFEAFFIRAPQITSCGADVEVLAEWKASRY